MSEVEVKVVDLEELVATFEQIIKEYGSDYVYTPPTEFSGCEYKTDGKPGCIVGHAIARLSPEAFRQLPYDIHQRFNAEKLDVNEYSTNLRNFKMRLTTGAAQFAQAIQSSQDGGNTWGKSFDAALKELG